jgi:cardiolipin synthase C
MRGFVLLIGFLFLSTAHADRVKLLPNNIDALQVRVDLIQQAKEEILVEYFSIWNDERSTGGMALLLDAARRGVKVKVIMDALGSKVPKSVYSAMREKGRDANGNINIEVKLYNPLSLNVFKATHRTHSKLLIVDGKRMITGGRNIGDKYYSAAGRHTMRDLDILLDGKEVLKARENFMTVYNSNFVRDAHREYNLPSHLLIESCEKPTVRDTERCEKRKKLLLRRYEETLIRIQETFEDIMDDTNESGVRPNTGRDWLSDVPSGSEVEFISHQPESLVSKSTADMNEAIVSMAMKAKRELYILSPYVIPTSFIFELFEDLISRGVSVKIITNSLYSTDSVLAQAAYQSSKERIIEMGVELYEYNGPDTAHAKAAIVDGTAVFVGTYNLDPRSAFINREVGVIVNSSPNNFIAEELYDILESHRKDSLLVGLNGQVQNLGQQKEKNKQASKKYRFLRQILKLFVPFFRNQI